ncbi:glycosyl hydrolase family 88 [Paenibacillus sp. FSL R7-0273]|uniref:glycoside hydrolase family 88/105 protein n=1 Tax=Paenibacillus sp. FSL R7-0273 TaxID=1536772 RepID=UPI0004F5AFBD|nr:glycoside hydrolase family 88 protein [Paenibacillus sp. FSL R7-0273]AIQ44664.1 glycosyl hydrolase family 88 [Paenibacillus sp. FSL R7-0273]OMF88197.1 glycoside hydrolase 105 family protein [Paenibacillus sp. FSL R7-0273]
MTVQGYGQKPDKAEIISKLNKVSDKLLKLDRPDNEAELQNLGEDAGRRGYFARDFGMEEWDWPQGVGLYGLQKLDRHFADGRYSAYAKPWMSRQLEKGLPSCNINTTAPLLSLMELAEAEELSLEWVEWLMNGLPRTNEQGYQHVTTGADKSEVTLNENEIWIDTLFMAILFTAKMGVKYDKPEWRQTSLHQLLLHIKYLYDKKTGLFYHGWHFTGRHNFSEAFWCRGNGWFSLGLPEYLELMRPYLDEGVFTYLQQVLQAQAEALLACQGADGLWHTLLDDPDSYTETSGSAAIAAGVLHGVRRGLLPEEYAALALKTIQAVLDRIDEEGTVLGVSGGTPIGKAKEDYKGIIIAPMAYGQAMTLVALGEALHYC